MPLGSGREVQRKGYCPKLSRKKTSLAVKALASKMTLHSSLPPSGCSSDLAGSHLAYSQVCWGSRKGPRQGHCCHSAHLTGWTFSNPLFLYSANEES